jgi:hypothetical protein
MSTPATQTTDISSFLDDFNTTIEDAYARLQRFTDKQNSTPRGDDKWSPKQIIGHLIDSAANNHSRFVRAQSTDDLVFPGYEQEKWVTFQGYQDRPWSELIDLWRLYNRHILNIIRLTPQEIRNKLRHKHNLHVTAAGTIREDEPVTLDYFMRDYVEHLKKHLSQIFESETA